MARTSEKADLLGRSAACEVRAKGYERKHLIRWGSGVLAACAGSTVAFLTGVSALATEAGNQEAVAGTAGGALVVAAAGLLSVCNSRRFDMSAASARREANLLAERVSALDAEDGLQ